MDVNHTVMPWGLEFDFASTEAYSGKMFIIVGTQKTEYLYHKKQDITLFVLQGMAILNVNGKNKTLNQGESYRILPKVIYSIYAPSEDTTMLEVGTKTEDDIVVVS